MEDTIIILEDEAVDEVVSVDDADEIIDASDVVVGSSYRDPSVRKRVIRHDAYNRPINDKPTDYVAFRYSRCDGDLSHPIVHNPVMQRFAKVQEDVDKVAKSRLSKTEKKAMIVKILNRFKQYLRGKNIRYRDIWRQIDTHDLLPKKQIW